MCLFFFFFKQKTAYEMRISDWSSDVVLFRSADLVEVAGLAADREHRQAAGVDLGLDVGECVVGRSAGLVEAVGGQAAVADGVREAAGDVLNVRDGHERVLAPAGLRW